MCDYSIRNVASRPAKVGDKLVSASFGASTNRGFASVADPKVAVCLLPGTELALARAPEYEHLLGRFFPSLRFRKAGGHMVARFCQVNQKEIGVHHDALEFPNGKKGLIAELIEGQYATVLQLPPSQRTNRSDDATRHTEPRASVLSDA